MIQLQTEWWFQDEIHYNSPQLSASVPFVKVGSPGGSFTMAGAYYDGCLLCACQTGCQENMRTWVNVYWLPGGNIDVPVRSRNSVAQLWDGVFAQGGRYAVATGTPPPNNYNVNMFKHFYISPPDMSECSKYSNYGDATPGAAQCAQWSYQSYAYALPTANPFQTPRPTPMWAHSGCMIQRGARPPESWKQPWGHNGDDGGWKEYPGENHDIYQKNYASTPHPTYGPMGTPQGWNADPMTDTSRWDICTGVIADTPCGATPNPQCGNCPWPASIGGRFRWNGSGTPEKPPILWWVDEASFTRRNPYAPNPTPIPSVWEQRNLNPSDWDHQMATAAADWNSQWPGPGVLWSKASSASQADIIVEGIDHYTWSHRLLEGPDDFAFTEIGNNVGGTGADRPDGCKDDIWFNQTLCGEPSPTPASTTTPIAPIHLFKQRRTYILVHLMHTEPNPPRDATWSYSTGSFWTYHVSVPVEMVLAHEIGHSLLGPDHQPSNGCPNAPTPWPIMCSPHNGPGSGGGTLHLDFNYHDAQGTPQAPYALKGHRHGFGHSG